MDKDNTLSKEIDNLINKHSGGELWRETVRLAVKRNPKIAQDVFYTIRDNRFLRETLIDTKYAESKDKTMRQAMRMPQSIDDLLCIVDPEVFPLNQHDKDKATKIIRKLHKVLPEFFIPERI